MSSTCAWWQSQEERRTRKMLFQKKRNANRWSWGVENSGMCHLFILSPLLPANIKICKRRRTKKHKHYEKVFHSVFYCCIMLKGKFDERKKHESCRPPKFFLLFNFRPFASTLHSVWSDLCGVRDVVVRVRSQEIWKLFLEKMQHQKNFEIKSLFQHSATSSSKLCKFHPIFLYARTWNFCFFFISNMQDCCFVLCCPLQPVMS